MLDVIYRDLFSYMFQSQFVIHTKPP